MILRLTTALAAAFAAAYLLAAPAVAGTRCGPAGYAYAGVQSLEGGHGIGARVTSLGQAAVESGHVAGWVGVGAPGEGPNGSDAWIQVGLNSLPSTGNTLYYEVTRPFAGTQYAEVARDLPNGKPLKLAVLEVAGQPDYWRVWINGRAASPAIQLVGTHGKLTPMAMAESWDGGRAACNRFAYKFEQVVVAKSPGGSWKTVREAAVLQDPGFRVSKRTLASFVASASQPLPAAPAPQPAAEAAAAPAPSAGPQSTRAQVVTVKPIVEQAPVRKGVLPAPRLEQAPVLPVAAQAAPLVEPAVPEYASASFVTATPQPVASEPLVLNGFLRALELFGEPETSY